MIVMTRKLQKLMNELKDTNPDTYFHSLHVKSLVCKMIRISNSEHKTEYTKDEIDAICKGALLHDIGKLFIKNAVLTKDSSLTPSERSDMAQHTELGYEKIACELTEQEHEIIKNICLYHHERSDGSGKNGMTDLPMYLRIVSLGDVFDALYSDRVYRKGLSYYETMDIIKKGGSGHFDDDVIDILETATSDLRDKVR